MCVCVRHCRWCSLPMCCQCYCCCAFLRARDGTSAGSGLRAYVSRGTLCGFSARSTSNVTALWLVFTCDALCQLRQRQSRAPRHTALTTVQVCGQ
jgi:hypothetical protein